VTRASDPEKGPGLTPEESLERQPVEVAGERSREQIPQALGRIRFAALLRVRHPGIGAPTALCRSIDPESFLAAVGPR